MQAGGLLLILGQPPLPPCLAKVQACAEAEFPDDEVCGVKPAVGQAIARQKHMAAFGAPVLATIKMVAKGHRIGHIAVVPFEWLAVVKFGVFCAHLVFFHAFSR